MILHLEKRLKNMRRRLIMVIKQNNYMLGKIKDIAKELYFPKDKDKLLFINKCFQESAKVVLDVLKAI